MSRALEGQPTILVIRGAVLREQMERARIDEADILQAARERQGIFRLEQIGLAVLEANGGISIVPVDRMGSR